MGFYIFLCTTVLLMIFHHIQLKLIYYIFPGKDHRRFHGFQHFAASKYLLLAKHYAGMKIIIESNLKNELPDNFLIISNHQSLFDILALTFSFPRFYVRFVAKKELKFGIPATSFFLRKGGHALIDRKGSFKESQKKLLKLSSLSRKKGFCPAIFPEGTRSRSGKVGKFHSAAVRMVLSRSQLPILSVATNGGYKIAKVKDLAKNLKNTVYRIKFLKLYAYTADRRQILLNLEQSRAEISDQVNQWQQK